MPTPGPDGNWQTEIHWKYVAKTDAAVNVLHLQGGVDVLDQTTADTIGAAVLDAYTTSNLDELFSEQWTFDFVTVEAVTEQIGPFLYNVNSGCNGTGDGLPLQVAPMIQLYTGQAGRSGRGRIFLPPPVEDKAAEMSLSSSGATIVNNFASALVSGLDAAGWPMAVWSRKNEALYTVTSTHVDNVLDTQKRRQERLS